MYTNFTTSKGTYFILDNRHFFSPKGRFFRIEISTSEYIKAYREEK